MICVWKRHIEDNDLWETSCGGMHEFVDGDPKDNNHRFCPYCGGELRMWHIWTKEELKEKLVVGARIRMGRYYCSVYSGGFQCGEEVELVKGTFELDNGLYTEYESSPAAPSGDPIDPYDSIYHLFGNELEHFYDCEIL